jgi:hypothetical protein
LNSGPFFQKNESELGVVTLSSLHKEEAALVSLTSYLFSPEKISAIQDPDPAQKLAWNSSDLAWYSAS